jgi:hypothetical protein
MYDYTKQDRRLREKALRDLVEQNFKLIELRPDSTQTSPLIEEDPYDDCAERLNRDEANV